MYIGPFNRKFTLGLIIGVFMLCGCSQKNPYDYLSLVLKNLDQLKSATYFQTLYAYNNGDSIPYGTRYQYYKEYINLSDTSVGASFLEYTGEDTLKVIYAYDGINQAWIDWNKKTVKIDDFQKNPYRFRVIMAPFMTYSKSIIKYSLEKKDSINIISTDYGDSVLYKITFYDQFLDFVGKLPVPVYNIPGIPDGSAKGKSTVYEIWIDKSNDLPYRIKREMPEDMFIRSIKKIRTNLNTVRDLKVSEYFPSNFPLIIREKKKFVLTELEKTKAPEWTLTNYNNEIISLNKIKSKILLIEFTGIGCGPCYQAIPFLRQLTIDNKNNDFDVISIEAWNKDIGLLKNYHEKNNLNYKFLISTANVLEEYHVELVPSFFILDENRVIKKIFEGYDVGITDKKIKEIIKDLL
jgi:thiol-disulfide isomerase/thioredoxin